MYGTADSGAGVGLGQFPLPVEEPTDLPPALQTERGARTLLAVIAAVGAALLLGDELIHRLRGR